MVMATVERSQILEDAVQLANEIERAEAAVKAMKDQLKTYVDETGPVETPDKVWGYNITTSWKFDAEALKSMAQYIVLEGMNPWNLLTLSSASLKRLGWGEEVLSQYGTKKETSRFSSRKK